MKNYSVEEALSIMGIGKTHFYAQVRAGKIRCVKSGRRTLVSEQAIQEWLAALPALQVTP